ncbi:uncharacterized protein N7473_006313 [Penicillium subrubescens]|uniref:uncharacterized protein n=1 Tax=Penicillium subrubescens TaxID=1316194 RepID=UPI002544FB27|nr:uncharacterized protein N7473_006313 [Penicillium subrubescens]KAJ5896914.1 hypothetical protein N7473_006313 [Penicillium subrubescens]
MKVIVIGGGIGGLAVATGLRRAGHLVIVFERSSFRDEVGAAIHVCPNASRVLLHWGFDAEKARMVAVRRSIVASGSSLQPILEVDCSSFAQTYGAPWYLAHRAELHSGLRHLATAPEGPGSPVEVILKSEAVAYDADEGSVTLTDASVHYADLIVAADGVHSSAVHQVTGHATPAASTGSAAFRFLIPTETLQQDPETASLLEDGLMRVIVAEGVRRLVWYPCSNNTIQNFVGIHADQQVKDGEKEDWSQAADVNDVLSQYHDFHPSLLKVLKKATSVKRWPLLYRDPISTWSRGRLVLIGDAAHPMLPHQGQGGAQAIEDAGALSEIFSNLPSSHTRDEISSRLVLFENVRMNRASAIQIFSNAGQDEPWKIRERARKYLPDSVEVPSLPSEFMEHNFRYDVIKDSRSHVDSFTQKGIQLSQVGLA